MINVLYSWNFIIDLHDLTFYLEFWLRGPPSPRLGQHKGHGQGSQSKSDKVCFALAVFLPCFEVNAVSMSMQQWQ